MDRAAEVTRIDRLVACLDDHELVAACERLEAQGLPVDDDGNVDIDTLTPEQLLVLSHELDKALFGKPTVPNKSEPLFRWPQESTKILDDPGNAEPADPPAKRARTSEDESHALLGVPFCADEGLSVELGADIASEMKKESGAGEPDADEEAEALREIMDWLRV